MLAPPLLLLLVAGCASVDGVAAPPGAVASATGFFVRGEGLLVTAAHAVMRCGRVEIASPHVPLAQARTVVIDAGADLALVRADGIEAPGVLAVARRRRRPSSYARAPVDRVVALGYPALRDAPALVAVEPRPAQVQIPPPTPDPRFAQWWKDARIGHGWSGAPVVAGGQVVGVILSVVTDPDEAVRLLGRPEIGLAAGAEAASVAALLDHVGAGVATGRGRGPARDAVVRVFCRGGA